MRRKRLHRWGWMLRGAIATFALAGAVYAAEVATTPDANNDLPKTIAAQRIGEGQVAPSGVSEHQRESFTPDQMIDLANQYGQEMRIASAHAEGLRNTAYRDHDLIRMTCLDDKVSQISTVIKLAGPRILSLAGTREDELVMRERFTVVAQARDRVSELSGELRDCYGDNLAAVPAGAIKEETPPPINDTIQDPSRPPNPTQEIDRPGEASPYR